MYARGGQLGSLTFKSLFSRCPLAFGKRTAKLFENQSVLYKSCGCIFTDYFVVTLIRLILYCSSIQVLHFFWLELLNQTWLTILSTPAWVHTTVWMITRLQSEQHLLFPIVKMSSLIHLLLGLLCSSATKLHVLIRILLHREMFMLVTAIGCTNMIPPDNSWLKRSNNDIVIGCYLSQQTWQLKCDGHEWKGQIGICPETCEKQWTTLVFVQKRDIRTNFLNNFQLPRVGPRRFNKIRLSNNSNFVISDQLSVKPICH